MEHVQENIVSEASSPPHKDAPIVESDIQISLHPLAKPEQTELPVSPINTGTPTAGASQAEKSEQHAMLAQGMLECGVCLGLICEPITISCGHTFCRACLVSSLKRSKKKCPSCRAVCHNSAEDQPENVMLANIAKSCFPTTYHERLREVASDKKHWSTLLPIFYYNLPMFPGETLSLHLFEPRYKLMMQRIVGTSRKFAYVPNYSNYSARLRDVAMLTELKEVEFLSDGRCLLEAKIVRRQQILEHFVEDGTQGLHYCRTSPLEDEPVPSERADAVNQLASKAMEDVNRLYLSNNEVKAQILEHHGEMPTSPEELSLWMVSILPLSIREKQNALETTNTEARLLLCVNTLAQH